MRPFRRLRGGWPRGRSSEPRRRLPYVQIGDLQAFIEAIFEYDWDELTALPSRLSAEPMERHERQVFLDKVMHDGFVSEYRGVRVTKSGKRFWIERATVWQLMDANGVVHGQAAMIPEVRPLDAPA